MKKYSRAEIMAARKELKRRAASASLANFTLYTSPDYLMGWVHREICDTLDQFLQDIVDKKSPRLIISMPPRSGKSEIVSRKFPAYMLGRYPDLSYIGTSYSGDLSSSFAKDVKNIMLGDPFKQAFPEIRLPRIGDGTGQINQSDRFDISGHKGMYYSVGIGGSLTGRGADCLVIDDPIANMSDALSERVRQSTWDWLTSTAYTRLSPGGGLIVMCTRWHLDDPVGRLIEEMNNGGEKYVVINYPAIAEVDEPHRKIGEALHPERFDEEALARIRRSVGERVWASLYQQHPIPDGGAMFKAEWVQHWTQDSLPKVFDKVVMSWDMTFKDTTNSDFVVGQVWGKKGANFYLLDQVRGRWDFVKTLQMFVEFTNKWPKARRRLIEDKANGPAIISAVKKKVSGIIPITPKESKEARAFSVTTFWEAKNVYLPPAELYPWVKTDFLSEVLTFPSAAHDDAVDAMTQALNDMGKHNGFKMHKSNLEILGLA